MSDYYYIGAAKVIGSDQVVLVKTESGYLSTGNIVKVSAGEKLIVAEVFCTTLATAGSAEETIMMSIMPAFEVEEIYVKHWSKKEEEEKDGN